MSTHRGYQTTRQPPTTSMDEGRGFEREGLKVKEEEEADDSKEFRRKRAKKGKGLRRRLGLIYEGKYQSLE